MQDGKHVVLCVDDDPDVLDGLKMVLEAGDYVAALAANGEDGLARFKEVSPDCMIVDLMMETVDAGLELVKQIRATNSDIPIFMLTSTGDAMANTLQPQEFGLSGILQKPVDPDMLMSLLESCK